MRWLLRTLLLALRYTAVLLVALVVLMLVKMLLTPSRQTPWPPGAIDQLPPLPPAEQQRLAERLAEVLRIPTVSGESEPPSAETLQALQDHLRATFPALHEALVREAVSRFALVYTWRGTDPARKPYLLLAHQDVVPIEPGTEPRWRYPPFSGAIAEGYVWGRGALDDKSSLMATMEAIDRLVRTGYRPRRTLYLALGHDEETLGLRGAAEVAALLARHGLRFELVLDEGGVVSRGFVPGVDRPLALIGTTEKGYVNLELIAGATGGHASTPPVHTAAGVLSQAIVQLEARPLPATMHGPMERQHAALGPDMPLALRLILTNQWLFRPLILRQMTQQPATNALVRTTFAVTVLEGSVKESVLPQQARGIVNVRLLPAAYALLGRTIRELFPEALIAPTLSLGGTDARHFAGLADNVYRFAPIVLGRDDLPRIHGTDERIAVADYARAVAFYERLLRNVDQDLVPL